MFTTTPDTDSSSITVQAATSANSKHRSMAMLVIACFSTAGTVQPTISSDIQHWARIDLPSG